jgi:hypothetical protein
MKRDPAPNPAEVAIATGELMVTARRLTARLPRLAESAPEQLASAVAVVRAGILDRLWAEVPPEAVRDVMVTAAETVYEAGVTEVPEAIAAMFPGELDGAGGMLEMTSEHLAAGKPEPAPGRFTPPYAFASSVAFDRSEDDETLASLSVLLTLAHLAMPKHPRDMTAEELRDYAGMDEDPEPDEYDPGPEVDDEGGMSEYRHHEPEPWS